MSELLPVIKDPGDYGGFELGGFELDFRKIQPNERVFWRLADLPGREPPSQSAFTPSQLPKVVRPIGPDIKVLAASDAEAAAVQKTFEGVAKNTMQHWPKVKKDLRPIITELADLHGKIKQEHYYAREPDEAKIGAWVARAKELLPPDKAAKLRKTADVDSAIKTHLKDLRRAANPLQIVVVPDDKHWLSMLDNFPNIERPATFAESNMIAMAGIGAMAVGEDVNVLFIAAQDAKPGSLVLEHETMHVVYESFLKGHPLRAKIDAERDKGLAGEGPVASPYSLVEGEFPTTMAELFLGHGGSEGTQWLAQHSRPTYDALVEIIGKNPLKLPPSTGA